MLTAVSIPLDLDIIPTTLAEKHALSNILHDREGWHEYQFRFRGRVPLLPTQHNGRLVRAAGAADGRKTECSSHWRNDYPYPHRPAVSDVQQEKPWPSGQIDSNKSDSL
jgi:hypothetical protein